MLLLVFALSGLTVHAQEQASSTPKLILDVNTVLIIVIILLLFVIGILGFTLRASMDVYKDRKRKKGDQFIKPMLLLIASFGALQAIGQEQTEAVVETVINPFTEAKIMRYILLGVLFLELITIFAFIYWIRFFTGIEELQAEKAEARKKRFGGLTTWWDRVNRLKPVEKEDSLDVGHSYDGIRELDNTVPPWFTIAFVASIVFGLAYLWRYHVAHSAPNQIEEYEISVTKAKLAQDAYRKLKGDAVNEQTVKMVDAAGIAAGKTLYANNCVACHGAEGQGGVGPNLTDDYWLHGGSIGKVFHTIQVGVVEKGMMPWKDVFSAEQIAEISSYIKSIHGTNPPGAKEPQGDIYKEEAAPAATDSTAVAATEKKDSTVTP